MMKDKWGERVAYIAVEVVAKDGYERNDSSVASKVSKLVFLLGLVSLIWMLLLLSLMQKALVIPIPSKSLRSGMTMGKKGDNGWGNEWDELSEGPERQDKALRAPTYFPPGQSTLAG
jgi:hypothetical protein